MAKNAPNVQQVLSAAQDIVKANNGKIHYSDFRSKLDESLPNNNQSLAEIIKRGMLLMIVESAGDTVNPQLYVVSQIGGK